MQMLPVLRGHRMKPRRPTTQEGYFIQTKGALGRTV
jgi:hypothetical protein